jgi:hypothetical protein
MKRILVLAVLAVAVASAMAVAKVNFGELYYEGTVVRTVVPPAAMPHQGMENLYVITDGVMGQRPVVATAPGAPGYRGGKWAFHSVTWNTPPYLLTSASAVQQAEGAGDVTITRVPGNDFKCPVQP